MAQRKQKKATNPMAIAVRSPLFKAKVVPSKKKPVYDRKKPQPIED